MLLIQFQCLHFFAVAMTFLLFNLTFIIKNTVLEVKREAVLQK